MAGKRKRNGQSTRKSKTSSCPEGADPCMFTKFCVHDIPATSAILHDLTNQTPSVRNRAALAAPSIIIDEDAFTATMLATDSCSQEVDFVFKLPIAVSPSSEDGTSRAWPASQTSPLDATIKPPRPPNSYILFRAGFVNANPNIDVPPGLHYSNMTASIWGKMGSGMRDPWVKKAAEVKQQYDADYKYNPTRRTRPQDSDKRKRNGRRGKGAQQDNDEPPQVKRRKLRNDSKLQEPDPVIESASTSVDTIIEPLVEPHIHAQTMDSIILPTLTSYNGDISLTIDVPAYDSTGGEPLFLPGDWEPQVEPATQQLDYGSPLLYSVPLGCQDFLYYI